jgi:hypothetical protein
MHAAEHTFEAGIGVGGLVAELAFATLDGRTRKIITNRQFEASGSTPKDG